MKVRFLGFNLDNQSKSISLEEYITHMITPEGKILNIGEYNRYMFFNKDSNKEYYLGLLVTVKDQKSYCKLVNDDGKMLVQISEIDSNENLMDFNFFVINKETGSGMYQYYHQSCSLNSFGYFITKEFNNYKTERTADELSTFIDEKEKEKQKKLLNKKYREKLMFEILVRHENIQALINELKKVKSFEYCFSSLTVDEPEFKPLQGHVRKERTRLSFTSDSPVQHLASTISNIVSSKQIEEGKVSGIDLDGIERVLRITNNPDNFAEYNYDDVASKINSLDISSFDNSWVIQELIRKCSENKHIIEAKTR